MTEHGEPSAPPASSAERIPGLKPGRRWAVAAALGLVVGAFPQGDVGWAVRAVAGWDAALVVLLVLPWRVILRSGPAETRKRAAREDPGAVGTLVVSLIASFVGLAATIVLLRRPERFVAAGWDDLLVGLGLLAVVGSWISMHTAFSLHYAHLYYRDDGDQGGLAFAGEPPDDLDFAYFAFGVGMTYQVSDVSVTDRGIRRVVLGHSLLSFAFNTAILALAINLLFGRV